MKIICVILCAFFTLNNSNLFAQEYVNPKLSVIGDFKSSFHKNKYEDSCNKLLFHAPEAEIHLDGFIYNNAEGHVVFGWHDNHNSELEELYATFNSNSKLKYKVGKYLLEFDNLNNIHSHEYSFVRRPITYQTFFGADGLKDMTVEIQYSFHDTKINNILFGVLQGEFMSHSHHDESETESDNFTNLGYYGRIREDISISDNSNLQVGLSVLSGAQDEEDDTLINKEYRSWFVGSDFQYSRNSDKSNSLDITSHTLVKWSENELNDSFLKSYGYFGEINYSFDQKLNIGFLMDYISNNEVHHDEINSLVYKENNSTKRLALFGGYILHEGSAISRGLIGYTKENDNSSYLEVIFQLVIHLGQHEHHKH